MSPSPPLGLNAPSTPPLVLAWLGVGALLAGWRGKHNRWTFFRGSGVRQPQANSRMDEGASTAADTLMIANGEAFIRVASHHRVTVLVDRVLSLLQPGGEECVVSVCALFGPAARATLSCASL